MVGDRFWSYLWGIEIKSAIKSVPPKCEFWSYLWGIEIQGPTVQYLYHFRVLILPMRDWNITLRIQKRGHQQVLILPMRDWNFKLAVGGICFFVVLILPMRDWNIDDTKDPDTDEYVLILPMRDWNARRSSFSLRGCSWFWSYLWGIEISFSPKVAKAVTRVLILPMRDWNVFNHFVFPFHFFVLILPMRDWNTSCTYPFGNT